MTDPANLITYMIKELTATETRGYISDQFLAEIGDTVTLETLYMEQENIYNLGKISDLSLWEQSINPTLLVLIQYYQTKKFPSKEKFKFLVYE